MALNIHKHIEDMIRKPWNDVMIMSVKNHSSDQTHYFLSIKNNRGHTEKIYIDKGDVDFFNGVIEKAKKDRIFLKRKAKEDKRVRDELKLKKLGEIKEIKDLEKVGIEDEDDT